MKRAGIGGLAVGKAHELRRLGNKKLSQSKNDKLRWIVAQVNDQTLGSNRRLNVARRIGCDNRTQFQIGNIVRQFLERVAGKVVRTPKSQIQGVVQHAARKQIQMAISALHGDVSDAA